MQVWGFSSNSRYTNSTNICYRKRNPSRASGKEPQFLPHIVCVYYLPPTVALLQYIWSHTSFHPAGELLRKECARPDSPHATFIKERIAQGDVVPYKLIMSLVKSEMSSALRSGRWANGIGKFILDGFPRDLDQAHSFDSEVSIFRLGEFQIY